jgi:uncharacterized repeat protein (TIGR03803 family)
MRILTLALVLSTMAALSVKRADAASETVLYTFAGDHDGVEPIGGLAMDSSGNLYGLTRRGGDMTVCDGAGCGTAFRLTPVAESWQKDTLRVFHGLQDGAAPSAGPILDAAGNLYGTTEGGGNLDACGNVGCGIAMQLTPASGRWKQNVLHEFRGETDGAQPIASMIFDRAGNLYGITNNGGAHGAGTVFELSPAGNGKWKGKVLYQFTGGADGCGPFASLVFDRAGNLYGTTLFGGLGQGVIFKLARSGGSWTQSVLYTFASVQDGSFPSSLIVDRAGNLYGTTNAGGTGGNGTAFRLSLTNGIWKKTILHNFTGKEDGGGLGAALVMDANGNLYGTTLFGGDMNTCSNGCGTVFKLERASGWKETVLYAFHASEDGGAPSSNLLLDNQGNLYGIAGGGADNAGVIFRVSP